jgi:hypothetical protein
MNPSTALRIAYWVSTLVLVFVLVSGGIGEFFHMWGTLETVSILGYPAYLLDIIGFWKIAAGIVLLVPISRTLREWAYAGIFFNMTGAAASHALAGDFGPFAFHVIATLLLAGLALAARALEARSAGQWAGLRVWGRLPRSRQLSSSISTS